MLKSWGVPVRQTEAKYDPRQGGAGRQKADSVEQKFMNMSKDELRKYEDDGKNLLESFEREKENERR